MQKKEEKKKERKSKKEEKKKQKDEAQARRWRQLAAQEDVPLQLLGGFSV